MPKTYRKPLSLSIRYMADDRYHQRMDGAIRPSLRRFKPHGVQQSWSGKSFVCHPVIAGFMIDYEEQVLITGIKSGNHCSICQVPPDQREDLSGRWEPRTHESTQSQICRQQKQSKSAQPDAMAVRSVANFAWKHTSVNIHSVMMVDILHQLLQGSAGSRG